MVETILDAARTRNIDLIVPVTDEAIVPIARARTRFAGVSALAVADDEALAVTREKQATIELARRLRVPIPRTALVTTRVEARRAATRLGWPVVLKPQMSRVMRSDGTILPLAVAYAGGLAHLDAQMERFEGLCPVLLQEYCQGEGRGVELLMDRGRMVASFQHRRIREVPITGGASSCRESMALDPTLRDHAVRLLQELDWTGLAMVEFKVGPRGPLLMEINGRIWGSLPLAVKSGVDFPALLADLYLRDAPDSVSETAYALGVRSRNVELEAVWIASVLRGRRRYPFLPAPPRRQALGAALRLLDPRDGYDILTREDPRPGLAEIGALPGKLGRKVAEVWRHR